MTFKIGMKVVHLGEGKDQMSMVPIGARIPNKGHVYTVSRILQSTRWVGELVLELVECDHSYRAIRFRPAVSPKQQVSFTTGAPRDSRKWDNRRKRVEVVS